MRNRIHRRTLVLASAAVLVVAALVVALWLLGVFGGKGPARVKYQADDYYLLVEFLDDDLVHFELSPFGPGPGVRKPIYTTPMVYKTDYPGPTRFSNDGRGTLETPEIMVQVNREDLCLTLTDKTKEPDLVLTTICPLNLEEDYKGITLTPQSFTHAYGLGEEFIDVGSADGDWVGRNRFTGDYGNVQEPWNNGSVGNDQFPIAYFAGQGSDSYALFMDNPYKQVWSFDKEPWRAVMAGDWVRFYVMTGPNLQDLRQDYMELTGRPPVPPKKAFGLWISEYGYDNWAELEDKLRTLRENRFPVDGFVLDLQWYGGIVENSDDTRQGSLTWDEQNFPDPQGKIASLREDEGVGIVAIEQSYIGKNLPEHADMQEKGYLVRKCEDCEPVYLTQNPWWGKGGMIDWTNEAARAYWHDWKREPLIEAGLVGHWTDLGEPELYHPKGWYAGLPSDGALLHDHPDVHNLYNLLWAQGIYEGYASNEHPQRPWILSRSGTSGIQRYGAAMWSGDISSLLSSLATHFNVQMHMSMSGVDYYGADIGGFWRQGGDLDEMYTQWFASGMAFDIPGRAHTFNLCNCNETAPDRIGDLDSNLANVRQRYELVPYLYSLAHRAYLYGEPVVPPLVYYYPDDLEVREMGHEKLLGRDLLVAVVAGDDEYQREVYLPAGRWVDYHSGEWYDSSGEWFGPLLEYPDGFFKLPMFARAGAILPQMYVDEQTMNVLGQRLDGSTRDELIVRVYADDTPSEFTLYEDDGRTVAYRQGEVRTTLISQQRWGGVVTVTIAPAEGTYSDAPVSRDNVVRLYVDGVLADRVTLNGAELTQYNSLAALDTAASGWYNAGNNLIVAKSGVADVSQPKSFHFTLAVPTPPPEVPPMPPLPTYWPTEGWRPAAPERVGMDSERLAGTVDFIRRKGLLVQRLLVIRSGYAAVDAPIYQVTEGTVYAQESTTPAFLSTLFGIALDQGYIDSLQQPMLDFFPDRTVANRDADKEAITLEDLLTMRSGLECNGFETTFEMLQSEDWVQFMLDRPVAEEPGTRFNPCDGVAHLLAAILQQATGVDALEFARENLFAPLGISPLEWKADPQGIRIGSAGLRMDPADTAKLGYLYSNQGLWDGQQVVSSAWVQAATREQVSAPQGSYGYLWWIDPVGYYSLGNRTQWMIVLPDLDLVAVVAGVLEEEDDGADIRVLLLAFIAPAAESTTPLPENEPAYALLQSRIEAERQGPQAEPVPPLPEMARDVSGQTYELEESPLGWQTLSLIFPGGPEALFVLAAGTDRITLSVGLDNIPRFPGETLGFTPLIATKGFWEADDTFALHISQYEVPEQSLIIRLTFTGDTIEVRLEVEGESIVVSGRRL